jgi:hypothetical protein
MRSGVHEIAVAWFLAAPAFGCARRSVPPPPPLSISIAKPVASSPPFARDEARAQLEVVRVDDTVDAFTTVDETKAESEGIEIRFENVLVGPGKFTKSSFARVTRAEGESSGAAIARLRRWLTAIPLPHDKRFALQLDFDFDPDTGELSKAWVRTFVLTGGPVIASDDVVTATAAGSETDAFVSVTLLPEASARLREASTEWTKRRLAVVLDGIVEMAPIVQTPLEGGRFSITMGAPPSSAESQLSKARHLALRLGSPAAR